MRDPCEAANLGEVKEITVSCDGAWSKRGFKYGFMSTIEMSTGLAVDYEVLSKYCKVCAMNEGKKTDEWWPEHCEECERNFDGSSPAMEVARWKILWRRSVEK